MATVDTRPGSTASGLLRGPRGGGDDPPDPGRGRRLTRLQEAEGISEHEVLWQFIKDNLNRKVNLGLIRQLHNILRRWRHATECEHPIPKNLRPYAVTLNHPNYARYGPVFEGPKGVPINLSLQEYLRIDQSKPISNSNRWYASRLPALFKQIWRSPGL
ncbi:uncharacterized protein BDZ99DRAFT_523789 [Mytilinidion resinicola]|uniref:Uncharacterized protein n=1 Tax=Mytilinidion resinicola TaxID=574789 RepID=A0A6A6YBY6_9PEZI|nr:uncharacterized protein BDZ99DRAFT_523789 [Mytilinidion resinicola]KAF2806331.1 hypothetical protein BDZ99DRAFT_523789 [Mytilinidion resinicola]